MEWVQTLRSFTTAVQEGSLSGAGRLLDLSPASISRHISSLEDRLETQLLKRSSRHLALTEAGEIYYARVEQVLAHVRRHGPLPPKSTAFHPKPRVGLVVSRVPRTAPPR